VSLCARVCETERESESQSWAIAYRNWELGSFWNEKNYMSDF
jgi:hypothetical protein